MKNIFLYSLATLSCAISTQAATIFVSAEIIGTSTTFDNQTITGTITYDETNITVPPATPPLDQFAPDAAFSITAFGQTFTHADDVDSVGFSPLPVVTFQSIAGATHVSFIFRVSEVPSAADPGHASPNITSITEPRITTIDLAFAPTPLVENSTYSGALTITADPIPEPSTGLLLLGSSLLLGMRHRR